MFASLSRICVFVALVVAAATAQAVRLQGTVRDSSGAAIVGASVVAKSGAFSASTTTDSQGAFVVDPAPQAGTLTLRAKGFGDIEHEWNAHAPTLNVNIEMTPAMVSQRLVVTATRTEVRLSDVAVSAVALSSEDLNTTPALLADDKLRQIPGFTLFRRSSSRTANPTAQGVSLSGLGASGASRAVVLQDGVPLSDPFGGWVYWGRVPQQGVQSVEVVRRGISSLYGSDGLGGAIQFIPRQEEQPAFSLETSYGNQQTPDLSFWGGGRAGAWDASLGADLFHTDGYFLVSKPDRGAIDTPANAEHAAVDLTLGRHFGERARVFGRGSFFTEGRNNGTEVQVNDTRLAQGVVGVDAQPETLGSFSVRLFGQAQAYNQSFSSVAAGRNSEALTNLQHVPAQQAGASVWWSKAMGQHTLVAGFEAGQVMGWSNESTFSAVTGAHTADIVSGGRQRTAGVYGQDIFRITPKWIATIGGRFDHWRNFDAERVNTAIASGITTVTPFAERSENAFSPRLSLLRAVTSNVSLTASVYRAFRAPTLNELYRSFRVGNIVTQANSDLRAERLTGAEVGANAYAFNRKLNLRGNFFWDEIVNPIANVTLDANSNPIQRQRQNLGRTRSRGVEFDAVARLTSTIELSGGYQFVNAVVRSFPADPTNNPPLVGLELPQIPRHQFTLQGRYYNPSGFTLGVQGRFASSQFEDDLNTAPLDRYFTVDLLVARSLGHGVEAFAAVENLFNQQYEVGRTPTPTLGPPFLGRIGLRFNFPQH